MSRETMITRALRLAAMAQGFNLCKPETQRLIAKTEPWFYAEIKLALANRIYGKMAASNSIAHHEQWNFRPKGKP